MNLILTQSKRRERKDAKSRILSKRKNLCVTALSAFIFPRYRQKTAVSSRYSPIVLPQIENGYWRRWEL